MTTQLWPSWHFWTLVLFGAGLASFFTTIGLFGWGPPQWTSFVALTRELILIPGTICSLAGAWIGRTFTTRSVIASRVASENGNTLVHQATKLMVVSCIGYLLGLLPGIIFLTVHADAGKLSVGSLLVNCAALSTITMISFVTGIAVGGEWAIVAGPVIVILLSVVPAGINPLLGPYKKSTRQVSIVWLNDFPLPGWHFTVQTLIFRSIFFVLITAALLISAEYFVTGGTARRRLASFSPWILVILMASWSVGVSPHLISRDQEDLVCSTDGEIEVCLLPAFKSLSPDVTRTASSIMNFLPDDIDPPKFFQNVGDADQPPSDSVFVSLTSAQSETDLSSEVADTLARYLSGAPACVQRATADKDWAESEPGQTSLQIQEALANTIQQRSGFNPETGRIDEQTGQPTVLSQQLSLESLSDQEFKKWFADNREVIATCAASESNMP